MSKLSKWWKGWNSPADVARQVAKYLRKEADHIAAWADRQVQLPEPFEDYDESAVRQAILGLAALIEKWARG